MENPGRPWGKAGPLRWSKDAEANPLAMRAAQRIAAREAGELEEGEDGRAAPLTVAAFQSSI